MPAAARRGMSAPAESLPTWHSLPLPTRAILCMPAAEKQAPHLVVTSVVISASASTIRPGGGAGCGGNWIFNSKYFAVGANCFFGSS